MITFHAPVLVKVNAPLSYELLQNYPNPFNPSTTIKFNISGVSIVSLRIYDIMGRLVKDFGELHYSTGEHSVTWNGRDEFGLSLTSGVYYYRLEANGQRVVKKMLLVK